MPVETKKQSLHAIAWLRWEHGKWVAEMTYLHAMDVAHAKALFVGGRERGQRYQINAVGPVIGYWAEETKDKKIIITV
jgi:hypothetical protein